VNLDAGLTCADAGDSSDVLHYSITSRDREGQEQRVERREVEAFS
jgi:hypothetical protein